MNCGAKRPGKEHGMEKIFKWQFAGGKNRSPNYSIAASEEEMVKRAVKQYQIPEEKIMILETRFIQDGQNGDKTGQY